MAIRTADFVAGGGFYEQFLPILEDVEFCHRLRRTGFRLRMDPQVLVRHSFGFGLFGSLRNGTTLLILVFIQLGFKLLHRGRAIFMLRPVILTLHDDIGRQMRNTHRGLGYVDVLAACTAGTIDVDAQVGRVDFDFNIVVYLGRDEHRRKRCVPAIP
jgi:hypothetical protein